MAYTQLNYPHTTDLEGVTKFEKMYVEDDLINRVLNDLRLMRETAIKSKYKLTKEQEQELATL